MGLFTPLAEALARFTSSPPEFQPVPFATVGEALLALNAMDPTPGGAALRIARAFITTTASRLCLAELDVSHALVNAPGDRIGQLWAASEWDTLAAELFGNLGVSVRPSIH